jgi:hypothetical protein
MKIIPPLILVCSIATSLMACSKGETEESPSPTPPSSSSNVEPARLLSQADGQPNIQKEFEGLRTSLVTGYDAAINQIQKSAIFEKANSNTGQFISQHGRGIVGWTGKLTRLSSSHGGDTASVEISSDGVSYRMSDIPRSSSPYQQLSTLRAGQMVRFTGQLKNNSSGKWEISLTERGSLTSPEFLIDIQRIESAEDGKFVLPTSTVVEDEVSPEDAAAAEILSRPVVDTKVVATPLPMERHTDRFCVQLAAAYINAIVARNGGLDPSQALNMSNFSEIDIEKHKAIINKVYFDSTLASAVDSSDLRYEIIQTCLNGPRKPFEPLR